MQDVQNNDIVDHKLNDYFSLFHKRKLLNAIIEEEEESHKHLACQSQGAIANKNLLIGWIFRLKNKNKTQKNQKVVSMFY